MLFHNLVRKYSTGKPAKHVKFPTIVEKAVSFVKMQGFAAHDVASVGPTIPNKKTSPPSYLWLKRSWAQCVNYIKVHGST